MGRLSHNLRRTYRQSGYIKKAGDLLIKYLRVYPVFLSGNLKIVLKNPNLLDPIAFLAASLFLCTTMLQTYWPSSPFDYYSFEAESRVLKFILEIIPKPLISVTIFFIVLLALPSVLFLLLLGFKVRPQRALRAILYSNSVSLVLIVLLELGLVTFLDLTGDRATEPTLVVYSIVASSITLILLIYSLRLFCVACGISITKYLLIYCAVQALIFGTLAGLRGLEAANRFLVSQLVGPIDISNKKYLSVWSHMEPTLPLGAVSMIDRTTKPDEVEPGDVIVFGEPTRDGLNVFASFGVTDFRVIATEGQTVEFTDGDLRIDSIKVERKPVQNREAVDVTIVESGSLDEYVDVMTEYVETLPNGRNYKVFQYGPEIFASQARYLVPENSYFVMGDNRPDSFGTETDFGFVNHDQLVGRIFFVVFPVDIGMVR